MADKTEGTLQDLGMQGRDPVGQDVFFLREEEEEKKSGKVRWWRADEAGGCH